MALDKFTQITKSGIVTTINFECHHLYSTGIATFSSGNISAVDGTFTGDVSIGGTLTYQDVTNIDSVGLVTARLGINVTAGVSTFAAAIDANGGVDISGGSGLVASTAKISDLTDNRVVVAGSSGELEDSANLTFDGSNLGVGSKVTVTNANADSRNLNSLGADINAAWIRLGDKAASKTFSNGLGIKFHDAGTAHWSTGTIGNQYYVSYTGSAGDELFPSSRTDALTFNTSGAAVFASDITAGGNLYIPDRIYHTGDTNTQIRFPAADTITAETGGSERLRITSDGDVGINVTPTNTDMAGVKPRLHVSGISTAGQFNTVARFESGPDNNDSGAAVVINHSNDRGLVIQGGRGGDADGSHHANSGLARFSLINNGGTFHKFMEAWGQNGQYIENISLFTGNNVERLRITGDGKVLVGDGSSITPVKQFDVRGTGFQSILVGSTNNQGAQLVIDGIGGGDASGGNYSAFAVGTNGHLEIKNYDADKNIILGTGSQIGANNTVVITDTQRVGIGTDAPADDPLTLYDSDNNVGMYFQCPASGNATNNGLRIGRNNTHCFIWNYQDAEIALATAGVERLTINNSGGPGITVTGEVAATQDYPTVRPTLDLNFVATNKLDSRVKFFRNSHATYIDKDGIVRIVGNNVPRFDYDPETKECLGLLMEGSSSSRLTQSSHNTAGVGLYHQIMTDNYYKGPDDIEGSAREYIHRGDSGSATGGSTSIWANQAIGIANPVSVSLFVKITRGSSMGFELLDNNNSLNSHRVDISGGYISDGSYATVSTNNPGNSEGTTSYQRFPNGWVKIKWENISGSGNTTTYMQLYLQNHATSTAVNPVGYAVWGFQVENEAFCTSTIIKNRTDIAAERGREVAIIDKEHFADFWNPLEGTAYVDALMPHSYSNSGIPAFSIKHTVNTSHSLGFFRDNGSSPVWHFFNDGAGVTARTAGASDFRYRSALAFKEADINGAINGVASMNQTSAFTMQKFDYMYLGSINTADNDLHGHLKRFTYYPKKLSDNQLLNITS